MIGIYNRGKKRINRTFIENIVDCPERELKVCGELSELQTHNIAIAHTSDKKWQQLITEYSGSGNVRVRVTVDGNFFDKPPLTNKNSVYTFHLVPHARNLAAAEWKEILTGLSDPDIVRTLVRGENPNGLKRFFVHEVQEHLAALAMLCEGYLAVHAEGTVDHKNIHHALDLMKWAEFRKSERGTELVRQNLGERMNDVRQSEWWLNVFKQESFDNDVKKEWKDTTGTEEIPTELNGLLEAIRSSESVVPPKIVADAYCVLQKKK